MSLRDVRRHIGQLAFVGFDGHSVPPELRALAKEFDLGGIVLAAGNVESAEQVAEIAREAQTLAQELPLWVSMDPDGRAAGGRSPFTEWPPLMTLGRSEDAQLAVRFARALAAELRAVGIGLVFTPLLDIHTNARNETTAGRALAASPEAVARLGRAIIETLQAEGMAACAGHFPGQGDAVADGDGDLLLVEHPPDHVAAVELVPFRAAIEAHVAAVMTAHVLVPSLDEERPATLSSAIVAGLLKAALGFDGIALAGDLGEGPVHARYGSAEATLRAIQAGCDAVLLLSPSVDAQAAALEAVLHAVERGDLPLKRVEDALARQRRVKERFLAPAVPRPLDARALRAVIGRDEHQAIAADMARFA